MEDGDVCNIRMRVSPELFYFFENLRIWRSIPKRSQIIRMWYVIQTRTGDEKELVHMIEELVPKDQYKECFYIKMECARKSENGWQICERAMFPGYLFVDTQTPKDVYFTLKQIPKLTKLLKEDGEVFLPVEEEERQFLTSIQSEGHLVRRSLVKLDKERQIIDAGGAVGKYFNQIVKQRVRKRYVLIRQQFLGKERNIMLGIKVDEEIE